MTKLVIDFPATPDSFRPPIAKELSSFLERHHFKPRLGEGLDYREGPIVLNLGRGAPAFVEPVGVTKYGYLVKMGRLTERPDAGPFDWWRTWGHFGSFGAADQVVRETWVEVYSKHKTLENLVACIFEVPEGFWFTRTETWYRLIQSQAGVKAQLCERPKRLPKDVLT